MTVLGKIDGLEVGDALLFERDGVGMSVYRLGLDVGGKTQLLDARIAGAMDDMVKGTSALELIDGRFDRTARAKVLFICNGLVIARVVEWDYA